MFPKFRLSQFQIFVKESTTPFFILILLTFLTLFEPDTLLIMQYQRLNSLTRITPSYYPSIKFTFCCFIFKFFNIKKEFRLNSCTVAYDACIATVEKGSITPCTPFCFFRRCFFSHCHPCFVLCYRYIKTVDGAHREAIIEVIKHAHRLLAVLGRCLDHSREVEALSKLQCLLELNHSLALIFVCDIKFGAHQNYIVGCAPTIFVIVLLQRFCSQIITILVLYVRD